MEYKKNSMEDVISKLSPSEQDKVKQTGSKAENMLNNTELLSFIQVYKYNLVKELTALNGFSEEQNSKRLGITQQIVGVEGFVDYLAKQVERKNKVVTLQNGPTI
jgi:hypothetical protein